MAKFACHFSSSTHASSEKMRVLETKPTLGFRRFYWIPPHDRDFFSNCVIRLYCQFSVDVELLYYRLIIVGDGKIHY